jgi:eukaryotic-like serine/threonine-protein kinase
MDGRSRVASQPSHPGTYFIGRYRVVDDIGVGGMATVHLGRMDGAGGFQKWVAIKRIHPHLVENEQIIKMFLDEARIAASISHPNVAQVFDLGSHEDTHWIAMEYLHGEPLREVLRHVMEVGPALEAPLAARIIADAAEGLHSAHELRGKDGQPLNLVHRDVTPHNLFLTYDGVVKVVDFGIAKVAGRLSTTQAGTLKGKIAYMAPEQIRGKDIDRRTDIFALGVVLWELTTGRRLFRMDTDLETVERVQACVVPPPSSMSYDYPVELESIVMRALQKRPEDRYQTARDFSRALQQYLMQAGQFVGPEEISVYVEDLFGERIKQREAHLKWAADVTKTLSFEQLRPAIVSAGLDIDSIRRDVQATSSSYEEYDDDDDDADETVVEPFRDVLMRQEAVRYTSDPQKPSTGPRPGAAPPGDPQPEDDSSRSLRSRARVQSLGVDVATDASTTRRVVSGEHARPASEPAMAADDLIDDDEDDIATIVRDPATMLKQDRLIVQRLREPSARRNASGAVPAPTHTPPPGVVPPPPGVVPPPPGVVPSPHSVTPSGIVPNPASAMQQGMPPMRPVMPSTPSRPVMPSTPPAMSSGQHAAAPGIGHASGPLNPMPMPGAAASQDYLRYTNPQGTGQYSTVDPYFDETQWARGLRGSPVIVYAAAAVGGFLIVAVLIAVLLGGPDGGPTPPPAPAPTATP